MQVAYNGEMVRIAPGPLRIIDDAPVGRLFRDGRLIVPSGDGPVRERRKLAAVGIIAVSLVLSRKGDLVADPQMALDGIPAEDAEGDPMDEHRALVRRGHDCDRSRPAAAATWKWWRKPSAAASAAPWPTPGARSPLSKCWPA